MTLADEYAGPYTERRGFDRSQAMLMAMSRKRGQHYNADSSNGPIGMPPGKPVGIGRHCDPAIGYAVYAVPVERTREIQEFLIRVPREAKELPEGVERLPDGTDVPVTRVGTVRSADTWPEEEEPLKETADAERAEAIAEPTR